MKPFVILTFILIFVSALIVTKCSEMKNIITYQSFNYTISHNV